MAYQKHDWQNGEVITEQHLDNIETGIEGAYNKLNDTESKIEKAYNRIESDDNYLTTTVFQKETEEVFRNANYYRIPFGCVTKHGTIVAGCDVRYTNSYDQSFIEIGVARSEDGGKTWIDKKIAMNNDNVNSSHSRIMDGTILYDEDADRIYLLGNNWKRGGDNWAESNNQKEEDWDIRLCYSEDDGRNWSEPTSLRDLCPEGVVSFIGGVGNGIKTSDGKLVFPIQIAKVDDNPYNTQSAIMYSENGTDWTISAAYVNANTSECSVFEYKGELYLNCRQEGAYKRAIYKTNDLGATWRKAPFSDNTKQYNACMGSTITVNRGDDLGTLVLFSSVNTPTRGNLTLRVLNYNDTYFNAVVNYYNKDSDGYSCLAYDKWNDKLYSIFETQGNLQFTDLTPALSYCCNSKSLDGIKEDEIGDLRKKSNTWAEFNTFNKMVTVGSGTEALKFSPIDPSESCYISFYKGGSVRSAYFGHPSRDNGNFEIANEVSGGNLLLRSTGGQVLCNGVQVATVNDIAHAANVNSIEVENAPAISGTAADEALNNLVVLANKNKEVINQIIAALKSAGIMQGE